MGLARIRKYAKKHDRGSEAVDLKVYTRTLQLWTVVTLKRLVEEGIENMRGMVGSESGRVGGLEVLMVIENCESRVASILVKLET